MAYNENLADRIRSVLPLREDLTEQKMFGGIAWMLDGKMFVGIVKEELMVRVGPDKYEEALAQPHVRPMDFTGKPMNGYIFVQPAGCQTPESIAAWVNWAVEFVATLPKKKPSKPTPIKIKA